MNRSSFTHDLLGWYDREQRPLPWRFDPSPYHIWISEIMAQQTQIPRVVEYYARWMARFPDIASLARSDEEQVLKLWEGLGYYSRARNVLRAARLIQTELGGTFPGSAAAIRALPGIGPYTAGAIASMGFGEPVTAVDANVLRVFSRLLDEGRSVSSTAVRRKIEAVVQELIPHDRPGDFNQALMELGGLVCTKVPRCAGCPVRDHCAALAAGTTVDRPVLPKARETIRIDMATGVLVHQGRVLVQKRKPDDVWPGLWEFPGGVIEPGENPRQAVAREFAEEVALAVEPLEKITVIRYSYTRYRVTMHAYVCRLAEGTTDEPVFHEAVDGGFVLPARLDSYAYPAGHRRLLDFMRSDVRWQTLLSNSME